MDQSKKGFLPVLQGVNLSQTQCPSTSEDREKMKIKRQNPNHEGNNISHSRKWQELELRIWKVVSGALQHSTTTRGSRPEI